MYMKKYEIPLGWVRFKPAPATAAALSPSVSRDITLLKNQVSWNSIKLEFSMTGHSEKVR